MNRSKSALLGVLTVIFAAATLTCCFVGPSKVSAGQRAPSGQHPSLELTAMWLQKNDLQPLPS